MHMPACRKLLLVALAAAVTSPAFAQPLAPTGAPLPAAALVPPAPYSMPWQLRTAGVGNILRLDTSLAFFSAPAPMAAGEERGSTLASTLYGSFKVTSHMALFARFALAHNDEPGPGVGRGTAVVNPLVGFTYAQALTPTWRAALTLGTSFAFGMAGDSDPGMDASAAAWSRASAARSGMDDPLFAVNYFTPILGLDVAWVARGATVQLEATLQQLFRMRNPEVDRDRARTSLTAGVHGGYFFLPWLSAGAELRHQRWLTTPRLVELDPGRRDMTTLALGPRFHFRIAQRIWARPGLSYTRGLDAPLADEEYNVLQLDLPVIF
jgi:hypothetical protein